MRLSHLLAPIVSCGLAVLLIVGCGENGENGGPAAPPPDDQPGSAALGWIDVSTSTTGSPVDPNGYTVILDGVRKRAVGVNHTVDFADVPAGRHQVLMTGVAGNCAVVGANPRLATVVDGQPTSVGFQVACADTAR